MSARPGIGTEARSVFREIQILLFCAGKCAVKQYSIEKKIALFNLYAFGRKCLYSISLRNFKFCLRKVYSQDECIYILFHGKYVLVVFAHIFLSHDSFLVN